MREPGHERLIGRTIAGKFVVEELLGAGAMGAVYRARQIALEKTVAIKVLHGEHAHDATFAARFHREAKAASRLNHPNSMQVVDFGAEPDGLLYISQWSTSTAGACTAYCAKNGRSQRRGSPTY